MTADRPQEEQTRGPAGSTQPAPRARRTPAWVWIVLAVLLVLGLPAAACGAFGFAFAAGASEPARALPGGPTVAVIEVEGQIVAGESAALGGAVAGSETIIDLVREAAETGSIDAVVLRVNSPGGDVVASDEIYHELARLEKPLVVSMGSLAASGGYYVSLPADHIFATPYTLTGSIGVISQFFNAEELLDELGVEVTVITSGEVKDFGSFTRDMTEAEREYWQSVINQTYEGFVGLVADERGLPVDEAQRLADGRVYVGGEAVELGLVDEIGYYEDAVAKAAELAGIEGEPNVIELTPSRTLLESLYGLQARQNAAQVFELLNRELAPPSLEFRYLAP